MDVPLHPELEKFVEDKVRQGGYASPAEVVQAALARLMLDPPVEGFDEDALAAIRESKAQITRGEVVDFKDFAADMRRKYLDK